MESKIDNNVRSTHVQDRTVLPQARTRTLFGKTNLIPSLKVAAILIASLTVFYQDLTMVVADALQSESMSHILVIPFLLAYLIYRKRKMIRASMLFNTSPLHKGTFSYSEIAGALVFCIAFLVYSYGSYTFTPLEYHMFALPIFVSACILIVFNTQTLKRLAFPILFLFFLIPPPVEIVYALGSTLSIISTEISCVALNLFGLATRITTVLGNPTITITQPNGTPLYFTVDIACSGVYPLIGFVIFATFIAYIARTKTWKKPAIFLIGLPLIYLLNVLRIIVIVLLGYYHGMGLALNIFHVLGGWTLLLISALLLLVITDKFVKINLFTRKEAVSCLECIPITELKQDFCSACGRLLKYPRTKLNKKDIAKLTALAIGAILIVSIQSPVFAAVTGPADILNQLTTGKPVTTEILPQIDNYRLRFVFRDKQFEQTLQQDASLIYAYIPVNSSGNTILVAVEIASAKSVLHPWEVCLITWPISHGVQTTVTQLDLRDVQLIENPPLIARYFAFQYKDNNVTQVILYWYETSTFSTNTTTQQKYVKISLIAFPAEAEPIQQTADELLKFAKTIVNYWQPMKTWTEIALLISKNGNYLLLIATTLLMIIILFQTFKQIKTKKANLRTYQKLPKQIKAIIDATHQTKTMPTVANITATYKKLSHTTISTDNLVQKLQQAQENNLVKKEIIDYQDEPLIGWKTKISLPKLTGKKAD